MRHLLTLIAAFLAAVSVSLAGQIEGRVLEVLPEGRMLKVELTKASDELSAGETVAFQVGLGDYAIGYQGRLIRGKAVNYSKLWHLERIFPLDGAQAKAVTEINRQLHEATATKTRRRALREGDSIPQFGMLDQNGDFIQIKQLRGKAFILNFIFTRCSVPEMCPASSTKMSALQDQARENGWGDLEFVTITFDPAYDSPGVLTEYMEGYGIEPDNFHMLTSSDPSVVEDLLYQFGILTRAEDGTITHTITTFLIDQNGKIVYTKDGPRWGTKEFIREAKQLVAKDSGA